MADETNSPHQEPRKKPRLGRGLSSLIVNSASPPADSAYQPVTGLPSLARLPAPGTAPIPDDKLRDMPIQQIGPNPYQPRHDFDPAELTALAQSISQQGLLQPLIIAPNPHAAEGLPYILVAGERRLRAARQLGLANVPCILRDATPQQMLEWALIENIHRADLNPIERAEAYRNYVDRFQLTQDAAAERLGQPRSTVANYLRLLDLCDEVQQMLADGRLTFGHGKVLAGLVADPARQLAMACKIVKDQLSVRGLEELVAAGGTLAGAKPTQGLAAKPAYIRDLEAQLTQAIGTRVTIQAGRARHSGHITIDYYSLDDFDRIAAALGAKLEG